MEHKLAREVLDALKFFDDPIERLEQKLAFIEAEDERKRYRRVLAKIMVLLECDLAQPIRNMTKTQNTDNAQEKRPPSPT